MAKGRYFNTKFWSDGYITELNPIEKVLFIYFLTNEKTDICGIYELPLKFMEVETGIKTTEIIKILQKFEKDRKILYKNGWIIVKNFPKHQNITSNDVIKGIKRSFSHIPEDIRVKAKEFGYSPNKEILSKDSGGTVPRLSPTKPNLTKPNLTDGNYIKKIYDEASKKFNKLKDL